jgi:hypothetical protein
MFESGKLEEKKVIAILGGGLKKNKDGHWMTTNYEDIGDKFGVLGDRLRVEAGALLYKSKKIKPLIVVSGGSVKKKRTPAISAVMKKELVELGVPESKIIKESRSNSTYCQLLFLKKMVARKKWTGIFILSNSWHLPRIRAMIDCLPGLKEFSEKGKINFLGAEDLLLKYDKKKWRKVILSAAASENYKRRIALEKKGVKDIRAGSYYFKKI